MNAQLIIALNVLGFCVGAILLHAPRLFKTEEGRPLLAAYVGVGAFSLAAIAFAPGLSGVFSGVLFFFFVAIPAIFSRLALRAGQKGDWRRCAFYWGVTASVHPTRVVFFSCRYAQALWRAHKNDDLTALERLRDASDGALKCAVEIALFIEKDEWAQALRLLRAQDASLFGWTPILIRAFGENGDLAGMTEAFKASECRLAQNDLTMARLWLLAFTGQTAAAERLLEGGCPHISMETRLYIRALGEAASGEWALAQAKFDLLDLRASATRLRKAARRHRAAMAFRRQPDEKTIIVSRQAAEEIGIEPLSLREPFYGVRIPLTLLLLFLNISAFSVAYFRNGDEDLRVLLDLGAMTTTRVFDNGEYWRLISAAFLHFGWAHLAPNMIALALAGGALERALGSLRFGFIYLAGLLASSSSVLLFFCIKDADNAIYMGASGAIYAVIAALGVAAFRQWRGERTIENRQRALTIFAAIIAQGAFDIFIPESSMLAHSSGCLVGIVCYLILTPTDDSAKKRANAPHSPH